MQENNIVHWNEAQWKTCCDQAQIISSHSLFGPKVIRLNTGEYIKVFNHKTGLTKRRWFPKYKTFVHNAAQLKKLGFETIEIAEIIYLRHMNAYAVRYFPLKGDDFRHVFKQNPQEGIIALMDFVVQLHNAGVYFHGMHLGNILYDDGQFGIIDMADLTFHPAPLRMDLRVRQLKRLLHYHQDHPYFESIGVKNILALYQLKAKLGITSSYFKILCLAFDL